MRNVKTIGISRRIALNITLTPRRSITSQTVPIRHPVRGQSAVSFYEIEAAEQSWTLGELKRQFDSSLYERLALSRDKKGIRQLATKGQIVASVNDVLKEPIVLEFLGLDRKAIYSESDLEDANIHAREYQLYLPGKAELRRKLIEWTKPRL